MLYGRDLECTRIAALVDAARESRSGVLVVRGEAGIGKTAVLEDAIANAVGFRVLVTTGFESESEIPFAGLASLLHGVVDELPGIPGPQAAALAGALAVGPSVPSDRFTVCAATLSLLAEVAERSPVLVVVDDLQWLDSSSRQALLFAARRLQAESVAVLLASRSPDDGDLDLSGLDVLTLQGLAPDAAQALLAGSGLSPDLQSQLYASTGGNPLALREIPALLAEHRPAPGAPLPPGASLDLALRRRIDALPATCRRALLVVAASESAGLGVVLAALRRLGTDLAALEPAERADVIAVRTDRIVFAHPLLRSVAYHRGSTADRCAAHLALAEAFSGSGAADGERAVDQRAWHLAAGTLTPDAGVAELLHDAGDRARRRGAFAAAARAYEAAARLSEDAELRARRLLYAARSGHVAGHAARSDELLSEALRATHEPRVRAAILHRRGYVQMWLDAPPRARRLLLEEAERVASIDPHRAALMRTDAAVSAIMAGDLTGALASVSDAGTTVRRASLDPSPMTTVVEVVALATLGRRADARARLGDLAAWLPAAHPVRDAQELLFVALVRIWLEEYTEAERLLGLVVDATRRASALGVLPYALGISCELEYRLGRWAAAYAKATESIRLAGETGQRNVHARFYLGRLDAACGRASATEWFDEVDERARRHEIGCLSTYVASGRGLLELSVGRPEEAIVQLERAAELAVAQQLREPGVVLWEPDLAEAYVRAGRPGDAMERLQRLRGRIDPAEHRWAGGALARVEGLLAPDGEFPAVFERARGLLTDQPFERARVDLCHGERLRRSRHRGAARRRLSTALRAFEALGAEAWAERTRIELRATGAVAVDRSPPRAAELTPQELQVALTVAGGVTNAEAAAALFLSAKTVEYHLTHVYRKLGVSSRRQLAAALGDAQPEGPAVG